MRLRLPPLLRRRTAAAVPPRLGLALGGGAVRGAAHVGVLSVLERAGVRPDVVSGTSVGAIVGAGVAAGLSAEELLGYFERARWRDLARPAWRSPLSMLDIDPMGELVERVCGARSFSDLDVPFAAVACDIKTGEPVVIVEGPLKEALVASAAIPGLFEPVRRGPHLLVDGGLADNVPVAAARLLGATTVIAVDIVPPPDGTYEPRDVRDMLFMSFGILQRAAASGREHADILIAPDVARIPFTDFSQVRAAYEAGVEAAEAELSALRAAARA